MVEEKRDDRAGYPFKMLLKEALARQRNEMMDNFHSDPSMTTDDGNQGIFDKHPFGEVKHPSRYKSILISPYLKAR
jgi:hypothetical protein